MALRIVIDARRIRDFGIGTYIRNLIHALAGLDDENVTGTSLEFGPLDVVHRSPIEDELDLVIGMAMRSGTRTGRAVEQEARDPDVPVLLADEVVRAAAMDEILRLKPSAANLAAGHLLNAFDRAVALAKSAAASLGLGGALRALRRG